MSFQTWLDSKKPFYERLLGSAGLFVVQNMLEEAYDAGREDAVVINYVTVPAPVPMQPYNPVYDDLVFDKPDSPHYPMQPDTKPLPFDWERTMYPEDECAYETFYRNNPNYQGAIGIACTCRKCSVHC